MDTLLTQMRTRYSSTRGERTEKAVSFKDGGEGEKTDEAGSITDGRIPPQKTQSFKGKISLMGEGEKTDEAGSSTDRRIPPQQTQSFKERKRPQLWWGRQASRQKSQDYSSNGVEYAVTVAAAAFAVNTLDEAGVPDQKKTSEQPKRSLTTTKSKKEDEAISAREGGGISRQLSGKTAAKVPESEDRKVSGIAETTEKTPQKPVRPSSSFRRTPTFAERLKSTNSKKPEIAAAEPEVPARVKPAEYQRQTSARPGIPPTDSQQQSPRRSATEEKEADAREKAELAKIKEGYEKLNSNILSWEEKRKKKARRRLDSTERELERKRKKAMERFRAEMEYTEQVVREARRKAEEWRRTKEIKAKEKANVRAPKSCFCC